MKFIVLAEDSLGERSAMVVTAENMPSALFTLAMEAANMPEDFPGGECTIIPVCDQPEDADSFEALEEDDRAMIRAYISGNIQRVNICDICICEDCEPGLCHSDGCYGRPDECPKDRLDAALMAEMQEESQVRLTMGAVVRIDAEA